MGRTGNDALAITQPKNTNVAFVKCVRLLGIRTSDDPRLCSGLGMGLDNCRNARNVHVHMETEHINIPLLNDISCPFRQHFLCLHCTMNFTLH